MKCRYSLEHSKYLHPGDRVTMSIIDLVFVSGKLLRGAVTVRIGVFFILSS